jgi:NTP pyrophosphatase (non-canonical NTP hydrolase)
MDIKQLQQTLQHFADLRDWNQYHTPKNLAMALAGECGELLEIFQWLTPEQSAGKQLGPINRQAVRDEIADIFIYTLRLADVLDIDLEEAFRDKMLKNENKYPVEKEQGRTGGFNR